jgi:predicted amidohydrolase
MKVAAYQAPLLAVGSMGALELIRQRVKWCESEGIEILCCPEAILGGLADYANHPNPFAIATHKLASAVSLIFSDTVTTIIGFTELADSGALYNSAAVVHRRSILGVYRKLHPAINRSVYHAGSDLPVFKVADLTFGMVICYDSNYPELTRRLAVQGATALFVPTNNGLPPKRADAELVSEARNVDIANAVENRMWVIRADVAGSTDELVSYGSSAIIDPDGKVVQLAREFEEDVIIAEIDAVPRSSLLRSSRVYGCNS